MSGQGSVPFQPWEDAEFMDQDKPVVCVTVDDAQAYCDWLAHKARLESPEFMNVLLPLPEMWNVAVFKTMHEKLDRQSWLGVSAAIHHRAGALAPCNNAPERTSDLGFVDLVGNVWEWSGTKGDWIVGLGLDEEAQKSIERYRQYWFLSKSQEYTGDPKDLFIPIPRMDEKLAWLLRRSYRGGGFRDDLAVRQPFRWSVNPQLNPGEDISEIDIGFRIVATMRLNRLPADIVERLHGCPSLQEAFKWPSETPASLPRQSGKLETKQTLAENAGLRYDSFVRTWWRLLRRDAPKRTDKPVKVPSWFRAISALPLRWLALGFPASILVLLIVWLSYQLGEIDVVGNGYCIAVHLLTNDWFRWGC
jgi:hypothetical protein